MCPISAWLSLVLPICNEASIIFALIFLSYPEYAKIINLKLFED